MLKAVSSITNAIGALNYKGTWNANTNTPALASGAGTKGDYYVVSVAGTTTLDGISNWGVGDWAVFNGSAWQRVEGGADLNGVNLSVTGVGVFAAGNVGAPAITTAGDLNTGIYFPAADTLCVGTNGVEHIRVNSSGFFKTSNTGGYNDPNGTYHELLSNDASDPVVNVIHFGANPNGIKIDFTAASPDNNTEYFLRCADSTTSRCFIWSDGDLANHDGVYGTISDERLKQDIVDAGSQWNDLKAVRFRKYRMKSDVGANPDAPAMLGVIAQELEQTSPGLIDEHQNEDGTTTKTVKSSILLMKAAVALQEAMLRIEALEAKVAALEASSNI